MWAVSPSKLTLAFQRHPTTVTEPSGLLLGLWTLRPIGHVPTAKTWPASLILAYQHLTVGPACRAALDRNPLRSLASLLLPAGRFTRFPFGPSRLQTQYTVDTAECQIFIAFGLNHLENSCYPTAAIGPKGYLTYLFDVIITVCDPAGPGRGQAGGRPGGVCSLCSHRRP